MSNNIKPIIQNSMPNKLRGGFSFIPRMNQSNFGNSMLTARLLPVRNKIQGDFNLQPTISPK